jgi:spoIIIJ-associated protein
MQTVEITAKTVQDATQQAADKLGVSPDHIKVTVIEEIKGLFGKSSVRVKGEVIEVAAPVAEATSAAEENATPEVPAKGGRAKRSSGKAAAVTEPAPEPATSPAPTPSIEPAPSLEPAKKPAPQIESALKADGGRRGRSRKAAEPVEDEALSADQSEASSEDVAASQADADTLLAIVKELLDSAQLAVTAEIGSLSGRYVNIVLDGRDVSFIVGKHGDVLNAMQYLVNIIASRKIVRGVRATLDGNDYRRRREEALTTLAQRIAEQVRVRGEEAVLDALPAFERRIVHKALGEMSGVTTYSEGEEPNRRVVIAPE